MLDETIISKAILETYNKKLINCLNLDVAIAGAGPAGIVASYYMAKAGLNVAIFERKLSPGGGMWGGGMMFNQIVVQENALEILNEFDISHEEYQKNYYVSDSVEAMSKILAKAMSAGVKIFNCISVEDTVIINNAVKGFVINWSTTEIANLHVDPLTVKSKYAIEATGHPLEVLTVLEKKAEAKLKTKTGKIMGERPMNADKAEKDTIKNTKEIYPGLFVVGMAANAAFGGPRMGPIFGGMLLSGKKAAEMIIKKFKKGKR